MSWVSEMVNFTSRQYSLLITSPNQKLMEWLTRYTIAKGLEGYCLRVPEEDTVLIIPKIDRFSEPGSLQRFIDDLKPKLLRSELTRFGASPEEFGHPITKETFDEFFDCFVRDSALLMSDLK